MNVFLIVPVQLGSDRLTGELKRKSWCSSDTTQLVWSQTSSAFLSFACLLSLFHSGHPAHHAAEREREREQQEKEREKEREQQQREREREREMRERERERTNEFIRGGKSSCCRSEPHQFLEPHFKLFFFNLGSHVLKLCFCFHGCCLRCSRAGRPDRLSALPFALA